MRKSFRIFAVTAIALAATALTAQAQGAKQFGIVAGVDFASFTGSDADLSTLGLDKGSSTGFLGGFYFGIPAGSSVVIEPEILYVGKGANYNVQSSLGSGSLSFNVDYIEIPVLLKYNFKPAGGPYILIGPDVAFNISCGISGSGDVDLSSLPGTSCVDLGTLAGIPFDANSVTVGGVFGLGFQHQKVGIEGRYEMDFGSTFKAPSGSSNNVKNAVWEILLRYQIK